MERHHNSRTGAIVFGHRSSTQGNRTYGIQSHYSKMLNT